MPCYSNVVGSMSSRRMRAARRALAALGFSEAVTWSFVSSKAAALFGGGGEALKLANPIAAELDCIDVVEGLVIKGGPHVEVLNAVSLHGGLVASWPARTDTGLLVASSVWATSCRR